MKCQYFVLFNVITQLYVIQDIPRHDGSCEATYCLCLPRPLSSGQAGAVRAAAAAAATLVLSTTPITPHRTLVLDTATADRLADSRTRRTHIPGRRAALVGLSAGQCGRRHSGHGVQFVVKVVVQAWAAGAKHVLAPRCERAVWGCQQLVGRVAVAAAACF